MSLPYYQVSHSRAQRSRIRVLLNDVPICSGKASGRTTSQEVINELIGPGDNVFLFEIAEAEWAKDAFNLALWRDGAPEHRLVDFTWGAESPPVDRAGKLPQVFSASFFVDDVTHVPCFRRAAPAEFGCDGLPQQIDLVMRMQQMVELKRADLWPDLMKLQHSELYAANHQNPGDHPSTRRDSLVELFSMEIRTRPLAASELHFERRAEGRVALVTRLDGSAPVTAVSEGVDADGFMMQLAPDLRMTRLDGRWQLF